MLLWDSNTLNPHLHNLRLTGSQLTQNTVGYIPHTPPNTTHIRLGLRLPGASDETNVNSNCGKENKYYFFFFTIFFVCNFISLSRSKNKNKHNQSNIDVHRKLQCRRKWLPPKSNTRVNGKCVLRVCIIITRLSTLQFYDYQ